MNSRQVAILGGIMLALVGLAGWIAISRTPAPPDKVALYPVLKGQLDKITAIKISKAGDVTAVELERQGDEWRVKQRNFAADRSKVRSLLLALENTQLNEEKTSNPASYATLGVEDVNSPTAGGSRVELTGIEPPIQLIIGKQDPTTQFAFVRRVGEKQSWLLSQSLIASTEVSQWLRRDLINVPADRVQEIAIQPGSGPRYAIVKTSRAEQNFDVNGVPKGREVNSVGATNSLAQTLSNLELDDVRPVAELASQKPAGHTTFQTFDGLIVEIDGYDMEGKHWIVLKPSFDGELAKRFHTAPAEAKPGETKTTAESLATLLANGESEANLTARKVDGWAFEVASFKYDVLFKPLEQLLKKK
ncbi:MAG TPA: DUF4340 domain-containing protein [Steroidobacteraceae bacterium]|nr:DUF4340 domain-containing protein [Steroidobacteraceae bacterium]